MQEQNHRRRTRAQPRQEFQHPGMPQKDELRPPAFSPGAGCDAQLGMRAPAAIVPAILQTCALRTVAQQARICATLRLAQRLPGDLSGPLHAP